jgi:hypothetical protein
VTVSKEVPVVSGDALVLRDASLLSMRAVGAFPSYEFNAAKA